MRFILSIAAALVLLGCSAPTATRPTPARVVETFKAAGLEAESPTPMTRDDYGLAPLVGEGVRFLIPSLCADCGGRAFVVPDVAERERLASYYREMGKASAAFFSHVYVRDAVVVQLNGTLPDDKAKAYEAALAAVK